MAYLPPSDPNTKESRYSVANKLMLLVGVLLLLPGLCTVVYATAMLSSEWRDTVESFRRGDPILQMVIFVWAVCLLIALGGAFLIRYARRRMGQR
jgi:hypothetical protein